MAGDSSSLARINLNRAATAGLIILVYLFLFSFLKIDLILKDTIITGGDTASHYYTAIYLKEHLLPQGRLLGWLPGNYAGFPLFQFYFPLPFLLMALVSLALPMTVAFKIISLAGVFSLPPAAYIFARNLGFKKPGPELSVVFMLPFLFMESTSMWGGNILSVMAGEFSYSLSLSLTLIYLGFLYKGIETGEKVVVNALLLSLVGLSHGYTLLFAVAGASYFLITTRQFLFRLVYILKVNILAFGFMGFWIMPLLLFMPQTVPYNVAWVIDTPWQIFPVIVWPFAGLGAAGLIFFTLKKTEPPETRRGAGFIIFLILLAPVLYLLGPRIGLVDVRFIPPAQALLLIAGAALAGRILHPLKLSAAAALALALITMAWTAHFENVTDQWMDWNYSGYESKRLWPTFQEINHYLQGDFSDPRVVYEHAEETGDVGSIRAFESLPLFSGRATLEGLYMQASLSAPFVFYLQSEVSKICSSPLANYNYSRFNLARADGHFQLFNVGHYITVTGEARTKAQSYPGLELLKTSEPFSIFRVKGNTGRYAVQPEYAPVLVLTKEPLAEAFAWFRFSDLKTPLVLAAEVNERDRKLFAEVLGSGLTWDKLANLPRMKLPHAPELEEIITDNEIIIRGAVPGRPLWIKTSYHPGWKVEGADKIWRASPAFMLVFPDKSEVRLYFARTWPEYVGLALTITALLFAAVTFTNRPKARPGIVGRLDSLLSPVTRIIKPRAGLILGIVLAVVFGALFLFILLTHHQDPIIFFNRGLKHYQAGQYQQARIFFSRAAERFPLSPVIDQTLHHLALSFFREESYDQAIKVWNRLPEEYPESRLLMEALYHIGLCRLGLGQFEPARIKFYEVIQLDPDSPWAVEAGLRLAEIKGSGG